MGNTWARVLHARSGRKTWYGYILVSASTAEPDYWGDDGGIGRRRDAIREAKRAARRVAEREGIAIRWKVYDHAANVDPFCADGFCAAPLVEEGIVEQLRGA